MTEKQIIKLEYPQNYPPYEDEINLIDYLLIIWKWKWVIVACTLICAVVAGVISLQMPKIYEISMLIEPGNTDSVTNISGKINEGVYNTKILKKLNLDPLKVGVNFRAAIVGETKLVTITSQWQEKDIDLGKKIAGQLILSLAEDYEKIVKRATGTYDNDIIVKQNELSQREISKKLKQASMKNIEQKKEGLLQARKKIEENMDKIIYQRDRLLKSKKDENSQALLLYSTTIQRNLTYFNQISSELYNVNDIEEKVKADIEEFALIISNIKAQLNMLHLNKDLISNIRVARELKVSASPVKPKKKQIVLFAGVVALFMIIFLAFFIEYIRNASKEL